MKQFWCLLIAALSLCLCGDVVAETKAASTGMLTQEGISGFIDKKGRAPVLSVGIKRGSSATAATKILADAYVANDEYNEYPIRFEFFVNRALVSTQLRSKELPGPVGIDVTSQMAPFPFNYSVVATLVTPNRTFTSVVYGAAFAADLTSTLSSCTLTLSDPVTIQDTGGERVYQAGNISVSQSGNSAISISFTTAKLADGSGAETISVQSDLTVDNEKTIGTISSATGEETPTTSKVSGSASVSSDNTLSSLKVSTADTFTTLECQSEKTQGS